MKAAANNLIPVSLELGGKSPTFVDESIAGTILNSYVCIA
jgi:acyl-CoA reductase-like NAD-dependent aldehyde dehydrogenase